MRADQVTCPSGGARVKRGSTIVFKGCLIRSVTD